MSEDRNGVELIFETLQKEYEGEEARNKHLETKVQMMLAIAGILINAIIVLVKAAVDLHKLMLLNVVLASMALSLVVYAMYELLQALKIKTFRRINHDVIASDSVLPMDRAKIMENLIEDYNECINISNDILKSKARSIKHGSNLVEVAVVLLGIVFFIVVATSYVERNEAMTKDSVNTNSTSTTVKTPQPAKPTTTGNTHVTNDNGKGFGTVPVERGHKK